MFAKHQNSVHTAKKNLSFLWPFRMSWPLKYQACTASLVSAGWFELDKLAVPLKAQPRMTNTISSSIIWTSQLWLNTAST
jgi:hypothetical protein